MKRIVMIGAVAGLAMVPLLIAQTPPAGGGNAGTVRRSLEKFTVDRRPEICAERTCRHAVLRI
jgi:hypothetical protein